MASLVSIVVPVYNGEKYLSRTLQSIKQQTYANIEVLLVDDASTDSSFLILNKFAETDKRFKVFSKESGGMVPKTMNFIMPYIKGAYFYYSSQDDIFSEDLIEKMVIRQMETKADTVLPDMEFYHENKSGNKRIVGLNFNRKKELTGEQALVESLNWNIHGFALFRSTLVKEEFFPEDAFDSDEYITRKLFFKSNKVVFSEGVFFYRQDNASAITKTFSVKNFYVLNTSKKLYDLLYQNQIPKKHVFKEQEKLLRSHFGYSAIQEFFPFNSELEKEKTKDFLVDFKKNILTRAYISRNILLAVKTFNVKYIVLFFVYQIPFLFNMVKPIYSKLVKIKMNTFVF